tara:strand:- start:7169 stop:7657 length:489 start_codon:yes stop_codon:yes gene_type:complete
MYLIVMLDNISIGIAWLIGFSAVFSVLGLFFKFAWVPMTKQDRYADKEEIEKSKVQSKVGFKFFKPAFTCFIILVILQSMTPTTKQAAVIVVVPTIINTVNENKGLQQIPKELISLANVWLKELHPDKVKETVKNAKNDVGEIVKDIKETSDNVKEAIGDGN